MNGVDFKERGQHAYAKKPSSSDKTFGKMEDIQMPAVPPEVLQKKTVEEQTTEMLEWFKAFRDNNYKTRDYRKYFRPVVIYLEAWWDKISDKTFMRYPYSRLMMDSLWGTRKSGNPSTFRPLTVWDNNGDTTTFAALQSQIKMQPVEKTNIRPKHFIPVDTLRSRVPADMTMDEFVESRRARYILNPVDSDHFSDKYHRMSLLDKAMAEVPGLDNGPASTRDDAFDQNVHSYDQRDKELNTGFYHRWFTVKENGAMGVRIRHRGYMDASVFMAQNNQSRVAERSVEDCKYVSGKKVCKTYTQKFSYAIPLAIFYLTPLNSWNPYKLPQVKTGREVQANGRRGLSKPESAYVSYSRDLCATVPREFFERRGESTRHALVGGKVVRVSGCGFRRVAIPKGLGRMRLVS